jgi:LmbE family N-acetylglucosaminyl deacetylase
MTSEHASKGDPGISDASSVQARDWLNRTGRTSLYVVSPHLDDAVYSAYAIMMSVATLTRTVVTVVTDAPQGAKLPWALRCGFPDSETEHAARRKEDAQALASMNVAYLHLGAHTENPSSIHARVRAFFEEVRPKLDGSIVLVPGGCGNYAGRALRMLNRLVRRKSRGPHPEHVMVRDAFVSLLQQVQSGVWGYYADYPYFFDDSLEGARRRLEMHAGRRLRVVLSTPESTAKLTATTAYASQAHELGPTDQARLSFVSRPEYLFVPER